MPQDAHEPLPEHSEPLVAQVLAELDIDPRTLVPWKQSRARGLVDLIGERAGSKWRAAAAVLIAGGSYELAANAAGVSRNRFDAVRKSKRDIGELLAECESAGFGVYELELSRRALAGSADRGSIRALEIVLRTRRPEYREKVMGQVEHIHRAEELGRSWVSGWQGEREPDSEIS